MRGLSLNFAFRTLAYIAAAFLAAMMLLTVADIALRATVRYPIRGMLELVELGLACTIFLALPAVFLRQEHLVVDVIDNFVGPRVKRVLAVLGALTGLVVLGIMLWQMIPQARYMMRMGDVTSDLSIARIWYWTPVLAGVAFSILALAAALGRSRK